MLASSASSRHRSRKQPLPFSSSSPITLINRVRTNLPLSSIWPRLTCPRCRPQASSSNHHPSSSLSSMRVRLRAPLVHTRWQPLATCQLLTLRLHRSWRTRSLNNRLPHLDLAKITGSVRGQIQLALSRSTTATSVWTGSAQLRSQPTSLYHRNTRSKARLLAFQ